jgi:hypothetical protein
MTLEWQPIETAPTDGTPIQAWVIQTWVEEYSNSGPKERKTEYWCPDVKIENGKLYSMEEYSGWEEFSDHSSVKTVFTHWMPQPTRPQDDNAI